MDKRCGRMETRKDHQTIGEHLVHLFGGPGKRAVGGPRRRNFGEPEQLEGLATSELKHDTGDRSSDEECIKRVVGQPTGAIEPFPKHCRLGRWWWICDPPQKAQDQNSEDRQPGRFMN
jgi:hypothetical protein